MADELPPSEQPIVVNPSATSEMITTGIRQLALVFGGFVTIAGFFHGHSLRAVVTWATSDDFGPFLTAILTVGAFLWGQIRTLRNKRKAVTMASAAPDSVAVVLEPRPLLERGEALIKRIF